jgi:formylglycine-generating enzyme required for sulfatase activity
MTVAHPLADGNPPNWASEWGQDKHGIFACLTVGGVTQRMRWIVPGRFLMGSPDDELGRFESEGPVHAVIISMGFWLFDTPCTQALWQVVMGDNPSGFRSPDRPVESVSWVDVQGFLAVINALVPDLRLSLPTEAQWEYACRAGTQTALYTGPIDTKGDGNAPALDPIAWYGGNSAGKSHPVGEKAPNGWGLYDMLGNVSEWCADGRRNYSLGGVTDPTVRTEEGTRRSLRGGAWHDLARDVRSANRYWGRADGKSDAVGFRCARGQTD